jgi:hypothetical protein
VLNPFMHSKIQFKQQKMEISPRSVSPDSGEKVQKVECLDNTVREILRGLFGPDLYRSSSGSIPQSWALVPLHSDDFRNFELLWVIS